MTQRIFDTAGNASAVNTGERQALVRGRSAKAAKRAGKHAVDLHELNEALASLPVSKALRDYDAAYARCASLKRKVDGGSVVASACAEDLAYWEEVLLNAQTTLADLARAWPLLRQHEPFAHALALDR